MQVDSVWPRCSSSSSATLVRRASSSLIWRTAVVLRKRVKKPARSAAKFQQNHCCHRCSLQILRFDMIWRLFKWHRKLELPCWIEFNQFCHNVRGSFGLQWLEFYWLQGLHHHYGRCGLGGHGGRQAGWNAGLHGWQAEDQGQHDAGPEVAVHFGGCEVKDVKMTLKMVSIEAWRSHHVCQTSFDMFWRYSVRERLDVGQLQSLWTGGHPSCSAKGGERIFKCLAPCCWKPHEHAAEFGWDQMISNADALCSREFFLR